MVIYTIPTSDCTPQTIVIGRRTTYDTLQVVFDLSYLAVTYGSGAAVLVVKRSQDETAYPATITQDGNTLTWTISETDTYYVGAGECELMWYVNNGLAKTIIYPVVVMRDILQTAEEPPDGYENWVEHLTELGAETQQHALDAAQSASEAESAKDDAVTAKEAASTSASAAATSASQAKTSEDNAKWWAERSNEYAGYAMDAQLDAATAASDAETAKTAAEAAQTSAETAAALLQPAATSADVGKALIVKTVSGGKATAYEYGDVGDGAVNDVQIGGTSIVNDGVAEIPIASGDTPGIVKIASDGSNGIGRWSSGNIYVNSATVAQIKTGTEGYRPIVPSKQNASVFYGLAKAAGDDTQSASSNPVGTYTDGAKAAIKDMIGATAGGIEFDDSATYAAGSIGAEVSNQKNAISQLQPTATASDVGKALVVKTVDTQTGKPTSYEYGDGSGGAVDDVQINGTSILSDGVANIPVASAQSLGAVKVNPNFGIGVNSDNVLYCNMAVASQIKAGTDGFKPITSLTAKTATFYGLAKAAGDTTQSASANSVGTYTEDAKSAIHEMLNGAVAVSGTTPSITAKSGITYVCGEVATLDITIPASGIFEVQFVSGSTPTVLTATGVSWAGGFDPTALEANKTYDISVSNGIGVAVWI